MRRNLNTRWNVKWKQYFSVLTSCHLFCVEGWGYDSGKALLFCTVWTVWMRTRNSVADSVRGRRQRENSGSVTENLPAAGYVCWVNYHGDWLRVWLTSLSGMHNRVSIISGLTSQSFPAFWNTLELFTVLVSRDHPVNRRVKTCLHSYFQFLFVFTFLY